MRLRVLAITAIAILLLAAVAAYSQPRLGLFNPQWEYAYAYYYFGSNIAICYAITGANGCRFDYLNNSQNLMRAAAVLGNDGWEIVGSMDSSVLYFKRIKPTQ